jgi:hypothetical protein
MKLVATAGALQRATSRIELAAGAARLRETCPAGGRPIVPVILRADRPGGPVNRAG